MTQSEKQQNFIYRVGVTRLIVFVVLAIIIIIGTYFSKPKSVKAPGFPPEQPLEMISEQPIKPECEALVVSGVDTANVYHCLSSRGPCSPEQLAYEQCIQG